MTDNPESEGSALQALGNHWHRSGYLLLMEKNLITARYISCYYILFIYQFALADSQQNGFAVFEFNCQLPKTRLFITHSSLF